VVKLIVSEWRNCSLSQSTNRRQQSCPQTNKRKNHQLRDDKYFDDDEVCLMMMKFAVDLFPRRSELLLNDDTRNDSRQTINLASTILSSIDNCTILRITHTKINNQQTGSMATNHKTIDRATAILFFPSDDQITNQLSDNDNIVLS
jgi:hypothetical protein